MSKAAAHVRNVEVLQPAIAEAWEQFARIDRQGCRYSTSREAAEALRNRQLGFAHAVYLEAVLFAVRSGVGSRGSAMVIDPAGSRVHDQLDESWRIADENPDFREKVQETVARPDGTVQNTWVDRRPLPESDTWFETAWARFRSGEVYDPPLSP